MARDLGMTVAQLVDGEVGPLGAVEAHEWRVYYLMEADEKKKRNQQRRG